MAYTPQYYPGSTSVGLNRRRRFSGTFEKLREIPESTTVQLNRIEDKLDKLEAKGRRPYEARVKVLRPRPCITEKKIQKLINNRTR